MHILILGGTTEASELASMLAQRGDIPATLSLAGRTQHPAAQKLPTRIGGFGGIDGLVSWMRDHNITALVDATHPFASVMPFNAAEAARLSNIPLIALTRPEWQPEAGDYWIQVPAHEDVMAALGRAPQRVFLTVGRLEIAGYSSVPQHFYLVRTIDPIEPKPLPNAHWITARGPFTIEGEQGLLREHGIQTLVSKNSGGIATRAKLIAARNLGIPVILVSRPPKPDVETTHRVSAVIDWILRAHSASL